MSLQVTLCRQIFLNGKCKDWLKGCGLWSIVVFFFHFFGKDIILTRVFGPTYVDNVTWSIAIKAFNFTKKYSVTSQVLLWCANVLTFGNICLILPFTLFLPPTADNRAYVALTSQILADMVCMQTITFFNKKCWKNNEIGSRGPSNPGLLLTQVMLHCCNIFQVIISSNDI